jgi:hypothetical protein
MKTTRILLILAVLVGLSWGVYECRYYLSYWNDLRQRPWAFSRDTTAPLLVGTWQGQFRDPDGIQKTITLTIHSPLTDDERAEKASRRVRRRSGLGSRGSRHYFDGEATVSSSKGTEHYDLHGNVATDDGHLLQTVHFGTPDGTPQLRRNFGLQSARDGGQWQADRLMLTLAFSYTTATGSAYSDSADPRYSRTASVQLNRSQP